MKDGEDDDDDNDVGQDGTANFSSDEELLDNNVTGNSENMFDSLKEDTSVDKSAEKSPEKPKPKRKLGPKMESNPSKRPKKKNSYSGSDDDFVKVRMISL